MGLTQKLELRQGQSLVMTPQMRQAVELLQMSSLEAKAFVAAQLQSNPLLEAGDEPEISKATAPLKDNPSMSVPPGDDHGAPLPPASVQPEKATTGAEQPLMAGYPLGWTGKTNTPRADSDPLAGLSAETSLHEQLMLQLHLQVSDATERLIGAYLVDMLDDAGYFTGAVDDIAAQLNVTPEQIEKMLFRIQTFEPCGVGARSLRECLTLQLREKGRFTPAMARLVDHLHLLADRDFTRLARSCRVGADELASMIAELRGLNPKPGHVFGSAAAQTVTPDILVRATHTGGFLVELNSATLPKVLVNNRYYAIVAAKSVAPGDRRYLNDCLARANWLVRCLDQRARTMLSVAQAIISRQNGFFLHGVQAFRPLTLKTVAEMVGLHESTVSRVTAGKFMATPRGTFSMKYFFDTALPAAQGNGAHAAKAVQYQIKTIIAAETPGAVLSDDMIVAQLRRGGVHVARRTIAKYRNLLNIPSSAVRKREKRRLALLSGQASGTGDG